MTTPPPALEGASAVAALLDRPQDAAGLREATERVALKPANQESLTRSLFVFRIGTEWLGLASSIVDEVVEPRMLHGLPHRRDGVIRGLVNVRGRLTICVALEHLFQGSGFATLADTTHAALGRRLIVVASQGHRLAFEVDEAHGTHRFDPAGLGDVPATVIHAAASFTTGLLSWGDRSVGVLDSAQVMHALGRRLG